MLLLEAASYLGTNVTSYNIDGIWVSLTQYTGSNLLNDSEHAHVNTHLTLILQGGTLEKRRIGDFERSAGDLVFFDAGEPHYNKKTVPGSRNMNFEFDASFFTKYGVNKNAFRRISNDNLQVKFLLLKIYRELRYGIHFSSDAIKMLLLALAELKVEDYEPGLVKKPLPAWVKKVRECIHDRWDQTVSLQELSVISGVHSITISKQFSKYFSCTFGEYIRSLKVNRAAALIKCSDSTLLEIAYECGFADQSHFIRTFKQLTGFLPNDFRKL